MKKGLLMGAAALVVSGFAPVTFPLLTTAASAAAPAVDACGLNQAQRNKGWQCISDAQVVGSQSNMVSGFTCVDREVSETSYTGINPAGQVDDDHTSTGGQESYGPWGATYAAFDYRTCNYPLLYPPPPPPPPPPPE
jgi:hypothetical protein